jgi:dipeptidyl aminopeptidase/acylaminoacyl peptidase
MRRRAFDRFLLLAALLVTEPAMAESGKRPFTVPDAIELSTVEEQAGRAIVPSPDASRFFTVETRGDLVSGSRISTLRVYRTADVARFLQSQSAGEAPVAASVSLRSATNDDAIGQARWTDDGTAIAFLSAESGHPDVYRFRPAVKALERITHTAEGVAGFDLRGRDCVFLARTGFAAVERDGHVAEVVRDRSLLSLLFPEEADEFKRYTTFVKHAASVQPLIRHAPALNWSEIRYFLSPTGRYVIATLPPDSIPDAWRAYQPPAAGQALATTVRARALQFQLIDLRTGERVPLLDAPTGSIVLSHDVTAAVWAPDERSVVLSNTMRTLSAATEAADPTITHTADVVVVRLDHGRPVGWEALNLPRQDGRHEVVRHIAWDEPERLRVVSSQAIGSASASAVDAPQAREWQTRYTRMDGRWTLTDRTGVTTGLEVRVGSAALQIEADANTPPRLIGRLMSGGERRVLRDFNPQLRSVQRWPVESLQWTDSTGKTWSGGLVEPKLPSGQSSPVVLALKYFDPTKFRPDGPYTTAFASQALAARGIAVLDVNAFDAATNGTEREGETQMRGIESALDMLAARGTIDVRRAGLIGFSRTSYYVAYALTHAPERFAAATIADGLDGGYMQYQLFTLNHFSGSVGREFERMQGGAPFGEGLRTWLRTSSIFNLDRVRAPLRVEMIQRYSVLQEWELYASLRRLEKPVDAVFLPDGTHVLVKPWERLASQGGNVDWYDFWLNGNEDPDPSKSAQYLRWRELKRLRAATLP